MKLIPLVVYTNKLISEYWNGISKVIGPLEGFGYKLIEIGI